MAHLPRPVEAPTYPQADTENTPVRPLRRSSVSLAKAEPWLAAQWHPDRNGAWTPKTIAQKSNLYAWWRCEDGHEWRSRINNRVAGRTGCPECFESADQAPAKEPLSVTDPGLAKMWHPTLNGRRTPDRVVASSTRLAWWLCRSNHRFEATPHSLSTTRNRCPKCPKRAVLPVKGTRRTFAEAFPGLAAQWHPTKNGDLTPRDVSSHSLARVWWLHDECGHEWQAQIEHRTVWAGPSCPGCSGRHLVPGVNDLATTHPLAASMWHPTKNGGLTPADVLLGSQSKAWFRCEQGHDWYAQIRSWKGGRTGYAGCTVCRGLERERERQAKAEALAAHRYERARIIPSTPLPPHVASFWHPTRNTDFAGPEFVSVFSRRSAWWRHEECGHEWFSPIRYESLPTTRAAGCPRCGRDAVPLKPRGRGPQSGSPKKRSRTPRAALEVKAPERPIPARAISFWDRGRNVALGDPNLLSEDSHRAVDWLCPCGHEWRRSIALVVRNNEGCPKCGASSADEARQAAA